MTADELNAWRWLKLATDADGTDPQMSEAYDHIYHLVERLRRVIKSDGERIMVLSKRLDEELGDLGRLAEADKLRLLADWFDTYEEAYERYESAMLTDELGEAEDVKKDLRCSALALEHLSARNKLLERLSARNMVLEQRLSRIREIAEGHEED